MVYCGQIMVHRQNWGKDEFALISVLANFSCKLGQIFVMNEACYDQI